MLSVSLKAHIRGLLAPVLLGVFLAGCAGPDDTIACPGISLREGFGQIVRAGNVSGQMVWIRLADVDVTCIDAGGGIIRMEALLRLKVIRDGGGSGDEENAGFDSTFVFVDRSDLVVERHVFSNSVAIDPGAISVDATARIVLNVPEGHRVVFGLGKRGA